MASGIDAVCGCAGDGSSRTSGFVAGPYALAVFLLVALLTACSSEDLYKERDFVGKWQSSRVTTPVYLYDTGEWEMKTDEGEVQQYGIWQYSHNKILWTVRVNGTILHDPNPVLSVSPEQFQIRERDGSVTTFRRL